MRLLTNISRNRNILESTIVISTEIMESVTR